MIRSAQTPAWSASPRNRQELSNLKPMCVVREDRVRLDIGVIVYCDHENRGTSTLAKVPDIEIAELTVRYRTAQGAVTALQDVSMKIPPRSFVSIVGPSGCGKTTLLKILSGVLKPSSGAVRFDGVSVEKANLSGKIGYIFQRPLLLPWRTAIENVMLTLEIARKDRSKTEREIEARRWLGLAGLSSFEERLPHELSGGMQQRVSLCRALALQPPLLLMDEPFAALDEITREAMQGELLRLWSATESSVLFITHSIGEAVLLSERIIVMSPRPGKVEEIIDVPFPRPRGEELRGTAEFTRLVEHIRRQLRKNEQQL
jgi:NitT/TauT family transport system ATP-binding protein